MCSLSPSIPTEREKTEAEAADHTSKATRSGHMHIHWGGVTNIIVIKVEGENFVHEICSLTSKNKPPHTRVKIHLFSPSPFPHTQQQQQHTQRHNKRFLKK